MAKACLCNAAFYPPGILCDSRRLGEHKISFSRVPHPEPKFFRETAFFSFSKSFHLFRLIRGKKIVIFLGGDEKLSSPGGPCTTLSTSIRFVQAFGQSFSLNTLVPDTQVSSSCGSSVDRITELLSRIKHGNRGIFYGDFSCGRPFFSAKKRLT